MDENKIYLHISIYMQILEHLNHRQSFCLCLFERRGSRSADATDCGTSHTRKTMSDYLGIQVGRRQNGRTAVSDWSTLCTNCSEMH